MRSNLKKGEEESGGNSHDINKAMQPLCQSSLTTEIEYTFCFSHSPEMYLIFLF